MRFLPPLFAFSAFILVRNVISTTLAADILRVPIRGSMLIRAANLFRIAMLLPRYCGSKPPL